MLLSVVILLSVLVDPTPCEIIETTITGDSMQGILFDGQHITVHTTACGGFQRYDHVLFTHDETSNAVVKQLWGMPGDIVEVKKNGSFTINGVKVLTPFKKTYVLLGAYKTRMKKLAGRPLEGYMLLGHPGSLDSVRVGLIPEENIIGFVKRDEPHIEN